MAGIGGSGGRIGRQGVFAALDLGTNNCRLLTAVASGDSFRVVDSFSRIVRLGEGLASTGRLSALAMARALDALHACRARLDRRPGCTIMAVATQACRRAVNGPEFLARVLDQTGLDFMIIPPREEVELAVESCGPLLDRSDRRALLFDIGGGSTELAWIRLDGGRRPEVIGYDSLPLGVVSLAEQHGDDAFTAHGWAAMVAQARRHLRAFEQIHCIGHEIREGGVQMIGTSGTVTTLAGVALDLVRYRRPLVDGMRLSTDAASSALHQVLQLGRDGLRAHPCIGADRAEFVLPGCAIFEAIRTQWPVHQVTIADRGLREGMLLRMMASSPSRLERRPGTIAAQVVPA